MLTRMRTLRLVTLTSVLSVAAFAGLACSAGGGGSGGDNSGAGNGTSGNSGGSAGISFGGAGLTGNGGSGITPGMGGESCQEFEINFDPKETTVLVLVDRSGSVFDSMAWEPLKEGVLTVVQQLQGDIRFGWAAFTGHVGSCPDYVDVKPQLNNYDAIASVYQPMGAYTKGTPETPTMQALGLAYDTLTAATEPEGEKYILFVTDGEPDYCGNGNPLCPVDAVVYRLQQLKAQGVGTFVLGLKSTLTTISGATLQAFANAGAGEPVLPPGGDAQKIYNECFYGGDSNAEGWKADWTAAGREAMQTLGTYSATDGTAPLFQPNATDTMELTRQISEVVSGVKKSCLFDLQGNIQVDLNQLNAATIAVCGELPEGTECSPATGTTIPLASDADPNGWRMNTATQLELVGSGCEAWRSVDAKKIDFGFPCEIIVR
jgi:hypothetical protein